MFRFYVSSLSAPGMTGTTVVGNGTPGGGPPPAPAAYFWAIAMFGGSASQQKFQLIWTSGGTQQPSLQIGPSTYVVADKWYHIALKVVDNGSNNSLYGYIDGLNTASTLNTNYIDAAVGSTRLGNIGMGQAQGFELAEFVFLEKALTDNEIAAYASSPYI